MTKIKNILVIVTVFSLTNIFTCYGMLQDINLNITEIEMQRFNETKALLSGETNYNKLMQEWDRAIRHADVEKVRSLAKEKSLSCSLYYTSVCAEFRPAVERQLRTSNSSHLFGDPLSRAIMYACEIKDLVQKAKYREIIEIVYATGACKFSMHEQYPCRKDVTCGCCSNFIRGSAIYFAAIRGESELLLLLLKLGIRIADCDAFDVRDCALTTCASAALEAAPGYTECRQRAHILYECLDKRDRCQTYASCGITCFAGLLCLLSL